jgi:putative transposase
MYVKGYGSPVELQQGLQDYFVDYNNVHLHPSLGYSTPDEVFRSDQGGRVCIVDKYRLINEPRQDLFEK